MFTTENFGRELSFSVKGGLRKTSSMDRDVIRRLGKDFQSNPFMTEGLRRLLNRELLPTEESHFANVVRLCGQSC